MKSSLILAGATLALTSAVAVAQSTAKPSPYEGVSQPPSSDVIRATEAPAVVPPPAATAAPAPTLPPPAVAQVKQAQAENPDYGIVEAPVTNHAGIGAQTPVLKRHNGSAYDPDADIVSSVPTPANALVAGTPIHTRLSNELSSSEDGVGTRFSAQVDQDVMQNGRVIIPTGSVVRGRVIHADYGRRVTGHASLRLLADEVVLPDGTHYSMSAVPSLTGRSTGTKVNAEGTILTRDNPKALAAQYGIAGGAGAATGAILGGPTGAIVGTGIGVGVITAHFLVNRQAVDLPEGASVTFGLTREMQLTPITATALK